MTGLELDPFEAERNVEVKNPANGTGKNGPPIEAGRWQPDESLYESRGWPAKSAHHGQVSSELFLPPPMKMAAIDIGSNSIHLIMVEITPEGDFHILGRHKDMVQLGRGGFSKHVLSCEAMDAGIAALKRILKMVRLRGITKVKAVATSAVREARNGGDFMRRVRSELGLIARVISSHEEGRLIYLGARHAMNFGKENHLVVDIGGGSMELIVGDAYQAKSILSAKLGGARLAEVFLESDPPAQGELLAMRRKIRAEVADMADTIRKFPLAGCVGTSGSVRNLLQIVRLAVGRPEDAGTTSGILTRADLKTATGLLAGTSRAQRLAIPGMDERRVHSLLPAAVVLRALLKALDIPHLRICDYALREGIVIDYIGTHRQKLLARATWPNPRERSVFRLARRCGFQNAHARQVARLSLRLFEELQPLHKLNEEAKELLYYAALLHDIGYMISQKGHHKHSYYLIKNGELRGFTERETDIIAIVARFHRKEKPKRSHALLRELSVEDRKIVTRLVALLRLANALDRTHFSVVQDLSCTVSTKLVRVLVSANADCELEIWTSKRHGSMFEKEFDRGLIVELAPDKTVGSREGDKAARKLPSLETLED